MDHERLMQQIQFVIEVDRLKQVIRRSHLIDASRHENSAEHSWHLAVLVMLLHEHANAPVDLLRVIQMVVIHDIVEIDAGDTYVYDPQAAVDKTEREQQAARRIFGLLPADQFQALHELWQEFEARETPEARFANVVDRLMPILHNYYTEGRSWQAHGITRDQVLALNQPMQEGSATLWAFVRTLIDDAVDKGYLAAGDAA